MFNHHKLSVKTANFNYNSIQIIIIYRHFHDRNSSDDNTIINHIPKAFKLKSINIQNQDIPNTKIASHKCIAN